MAGGIGTDGPSSDINVTPLVDVMLVLLIIFMVTAPMMQQGVEVDLPKAATGALKGSSEQVVLSIDASGKLFLGAGNEVSVEQLAPRVKAIMETRPEGDRKLYIKADKVLGYGKVMEVMGRLYESGITQVALMTDSPGKV